MSHAMGTEVDPTHVANADSNSDSVDATLSKPSPTAPVKFPAKQPKPASSSLTDAALTTTDTASSSGPAPSKKTRFQLDESPHHVIFVVHGLGRQLEEFGNYERNVAYLVENTKTVLQSQFHELDTDVHIIPIEWHAKLHSLVDQRMSLTSLRTVPKVRLVMNDYFADILYYFNNHYGAEIVRMIVDELNEAYSTFTAKHPSFDGKISVYALSLGGVAMYDILTCMDDDESDESPAADERSADRGKDRDGERKDAETGSTAKSNKTRIRKQDQPKFRTVVPKLKFRPNFLFTVGSPVGAVMVMRNLDWETFHPPDDIIHHNLFHPFDPLAYRIEPLIDPIFAAIPAVTLTSTGNSQLFPISLPSLPSLPSMPSLPLPSMPSMPSMSSIPGSISSFWESKARPAIPTLSTLSQKAQSFSPRRWKSAGGAGGEGAAGDRDGEASTPVADGRGQTKPAPTNGGPAKEGRVDPRENREKCVADMTYTHTTPAYCGREAMETRNQLSDPAYDRDDTSASVSEALAAATAATYIDQGPSWAASSERYTGDKDINTTTGSTSVVAGSPRRPAIGPRRVSSRVDDETSDNDEQDSDDPNSSTTMASQQQGIDDLPPLRMEFYLGLDSGPTPDEKARGLGAKSDAVQEDMVRSIPTSPISKAHAEHAHMRSLDQTSVTGTEKKPPKEEGLEDLQAYHKEQEQAKLHEKICEDREFEKPARKVTITEEEDEKGKHDPSPDDPLQSKTKIDKDEEPQVDTRSCPVHVGGRATKVPYRIDHVLQETKVDQYTNEYLLGMRSHFRYWGNRDIAYHILRTMLRPKSGQDEDSEGGFLDLRPEMPAQVTASKNAKVAAEAKAKAAAAAYRRSSQDLNHGNHPRPSAFSFLYNSSTTSSETRPNTRHASSYGYGDEEEQLFGYRYSDLDMNSAANVSFSGQTLYQSSPFASNSNMDSAGVDSRSSSVTEALTQPNKVITGLETMVEVLVTVITKSSSSSNSIAATSKVMGKIEGLNPHNSKKAQDRLPQQAYRRLMKELWCHNSHDRPNCIIGHLG
ncbi:hypothetical protein BGZ70_006604 [Mortierella alpina]|uniref:DDHD domain-containing protein n=1 Tax=Mortierella alpina TaxID=64518 RepID=A0A9P6M3K2_MORAP|nr:hypothetical protein BGZ70_006604 [Mortierella alpina]